MKEILAMQIHQIWNPVFLADQSSGWFANLMDWSYDHIIYVIAGMVVLGVILTLLNLASRLLTLQEIEKSQQLGVERKEIVSSLKIPSWKRLYDRAWNMVPIQKEESIDLGHNYDGIRELDNRLPPWWLATFYGSIIFAVIYMFHYHWSGNEWSSKQEYEMAMKVAEQEKSDYLATLANKVDESNVEMLTDEATLAEGKSIYMANCLACHGQSGEGLVGPNFTDEYWIHGGGIVNVFKTVKYGVPEKGMIAWNTQLSPTGMQAVSSYILTMQGTNPPNQKEAQGELYVEETPSTSSDTLEVDMSVDQ